MNKHCQKPRLRPVPLAVLLSALVLFLCSFNANAQKFIKYFHSPSLNQESHKVIQTHDQNYLTLSTLPFTYNDVLIAKYDKYGKMIFSRSVALPTSYSTDLLPVAIAENPSDYSLAIVGSTSDATSTHQFLLKTDKDGNFLWYRQWDGLNAKAVLFTHDPSNSNDIVVAGTYLNSTSHEAMISIYNNSGTLIKTGRYHDNGASIDVADMVEIQSKSTYCLAVNYTATSGTTYPAYLQFDYAVTTGNMYYYVSSTWSNQSVIAMTKYEPSGGNPKIYVMGSCTSYSLQVPFVMSVDLVTHTITPVGFLNSTFTANDVVIPSGICLMNTTTPKLMICGIYENAATGVYKPFVFNTNLSSGTILHIHNADEVNYKSVTSTNDPNYYVINGDDGLGESITRCGASDSISCDSMLVYTSSYTQGEWILSGTFVSYTYSPSSITASVTDYTTTFENICGCWEGVSKNTFSEVINGNFNTNDFLQADFDNYGQDIYVPSTIVDPLGNHNISVSQFHNDGHLASSHTYSITNVQHDALASKRCFNGDIVTAGRRTDPSTSYPYLFVMRTNSAGGVAWYKAFPQSVSWDNYYVVITETTSGDIVVAGSSTLTNSIELVRMDGAGTVRYHEQVQVSAAGNPGEIYPFMRGITATYDNGFVLVGTTGENNDFFGALVLKYDASYTIATHHTLNWHYIYRHKLTAYDLSVPSERSSTYASGVVQEPSNDLAIVGYVSNNDQFGNSATFENGFVLRLDPSGAFLNLGMFKPGKSTQFVRFNGIGMAGLNYIITGQVYTPAVGTYQTMMMVTDPTMTISWAKVYGSGTYNIGCSVFIDSKGFICAGVSNGNTTPEQPNIIQTDGSGNVSPCSGAFSIGLVNDANDQPTYSETYYTIGGAIMDMPTMTDVCYTPVDLCPASMQPSQITGIGNNLMDHSGSVKMYPNPTSNILNIDLNADEASKGSMQILDMQGRVVSENVMTIVPGVNHTELDIANLKPGIYFVKVTDDKNKVYPINKIEKY